MESSYGSILAILSRSIVLRSFVIIFSCTRWELLPTEKPPLFDRSRSLGPHEENPLPNAELVNVHSEISKSGYLLEAWFPREVLVGFDPDIQSQIGFHYIVQDSEFGSQTLAVGNEFPFESDPSLWQTVELIA